MRFTSASLSIAHVAPIDALDLVDLRGVDVQMRDELRPARELRRIAGHAIVESRTNGHQEIAVLHGVVRERRAVHAEHAHGQRVDGVDRADAHERGHHRDLQVLDELAQRLRGRGIDHAAAGVDQRPLRGRQRLEEGGAGAIRQLVRPQTVHALPVAGNRQPAGSVEDSLPVLHVLRDIEHHGAGAAGARDLERGAHRRLELGRVGDQENVLGDRTHDARHRRFLKCIRADGRGRDLAADDHDGHRVGLAVAHRRDRVGRARAGGDQRDADPPARARIARGHESGALLVRGHDQRHGGAVLLVVAEDGVVNRQNGAAAVAENRVDALVRQHLDEHVRARHTGPRQRMRVFIQHVVAVFHSKSLAVLALAPKCRPPVSFAHAASHRVTIAK